MQADLTDGHQIAWEWSDSEDVRATSSSLRDLARRIDENRATLLEQLNSLACAMHRACKREPGDCCTIGSVIGEWDKQYEAEAYRAEQAEAARDDACRARETMRDDACAYLVQRDLLAAALRATRDHEAQDGPCWCRKYTPSTPEWQIRLGGHGCVCLQARAALAHCNPTMSSRPRIVCLCGSTRFWKTFRDEGLRLTLAGYIVLSIGICAPDSMTLSHPDTPEGREQKRQLDELHKRKIDLADEVSVLNVGGYIGDSTRSEIEYARAHKKPVRYLEPTSSPTEPNFTTPVPSRYHRSCASADAPFGCEDCRPESTP